MSCVRSATKIWPVEATTPKTPALLPSVMLTVRPPAPSVSSGSTSPGEADSAAPTLAWFVAFSHTKKAGSVWSTPGCGVKALLKTGGSLRLLMLSASVPVA